MIFQSAIERRHFVGQIRYGDALAEQIGSENNAAVFQSDLRVFELIAVGLLLRNLHCCE